MLDSDGNCISVIEELLGEKKPARSYWEKYVCCCLFRRKSVRFEN